MKKLLVFSVIGISLSAQANLIEVPVSFQEALAPQDTTSSSRFQNEYTSAIEAGKKLVDGELKKCGYSIKHSTEFYEASDPLQARERSSKAQKENAWLVVAPRRSNHYLLSVEGATETPTVSLMANASKVFELGDLHLTMGMSNDVIAKAAYEAGLKELKKKKVSYLTIVNEDCVFCLDLAKTFDTQMKGQKKLGEFKVVSDTPDILKLKEQLKGLSPDIIVLPNYSKSSSHVMAGLKDVFPKAIYISGDGWGSSAFGYVQNGNNLAGVVGFSARGSVPSEDALKTFPVGRALLAKPTVARKFPASNSALSILKIVEAVKDLLCSEKPKTRSEFLAAYKKKGRSYFKPSWGAGIYKLQDSNLSFVGTAKE